MWSFAARFSRFIRGQHWSTLAVLVVFSAPLSWAQSSTQQPAQSTQSLQGERAELDKQIARAQSLIAKSEADQKENRRSLALIRREIELRDELLENLSKEQGAVGAALASEAGGLDSLELRLARLRAEFGATLRTTRRLSASDDLWAFLLDAESFTMAMRRWGWVRSYTALRLEQADELEATLARIEKRHDRLEGKQNELDAVSRQLQNERTVQNRKRSSQQRTLSRLRAEESEFHKDIAAAQKKQEELDKAIAAMIEAARKAAAAGRGYGATPAGQATAAEFVANKGRLNWPVREGTLVGIFGTHPHPSFPGIVVSNNGIDIATTADATIRAVFNGQVSNVTEFPGLGWVVMIDHGSHRSVYSNLRAPVVAKGDLVATGAKLGQVLDLGDGAASHFEIWDAGGSSPSDPLLWIAR